MGFFEHVVQLAYRKFASVILSLSNFDGTTCRFVLLRFSWLQKTDDCVSEYVAAGLGDFGFVHGTLVAVLTHHPV